MTHFKWLILVATLFAALAHRVHAGPDQDQFEVAAAHYNGRRWQLAADEFRIFLEQNPQHAQRDEAIFRAAEALMQLVRYGDADEFYQRYLELTPEGSPTDTYTAKALFRRGEIAYFTGPVDFAKDKLAEFRNRFPHDALNEFALLYLGDLELSGNDAVAAQKSFAQLISDFPQGELVAEAEYGLARALDSLGHHTEALARFKGLARQDGAASRQARLQLALAAHREQDYAQVEKHLAPFAGDALHDSLRTQALYWLGMSRHARQQWLEAAETFSAAVSNTPQHTLAPTLHLRAGNAYRLASRLDEAMAHFDAILAQWPDSEFVVDALLAHAQLAFERKDYSRLHELARQIAVEHPNSGRLGEVRELSARALLSAGQYVEAAQLFEEWLRTTDEELPNDTAWYLCALAQLGNNQPHDALASLVKIEDLPHDSTLYQGVLVAQASAWMAVERYAEAIQPLQAYLALDANGQDVAKCQSDLAMCLAKTGQMVEASQWWHRFRQNNKQHPQLLPVAYFLAVTADDQGNDSWANELYTFLTTEGHPAEYVQKGRQGLMWSSLSGGDESAAEFEDLLRKNIDDPQTPLAALERARRLERDDTSDGNIVGALAIYRWIVEELPTSEKVPDAMFAAARLHDRLDQDTDAERLLHRLIAEYPEFKHRDAALYVLAWVLLDLDRHDESLELFQQVHREHSNSSYWPDATYRLAEVAVNEKDYSQAQQLCKQISAQGCEPDLLGHVLYLQGRAAALASEWPEALLPLERLLRELPQHELSFVAEYWIAESLFRQGMYDEAGERLARLARWPTEPNGSPVAAWTGVIPLRQAQVLGHQRKWDESLQVAQRVIEQFPDFRQLYEAHYLIGRSLANDGQFNAAREAYELVLSSPAGGQSETAAMAQWMIGESYFHQKQYDNAIRAYLRVEILYDFPSWRAHALLQAGKCYEEKNLGNEAIRLYARILKEFPESKLVDKASERMRLASRDQR